MFLPLLFFLFASVRQQGIAPYQYPSLIDQAKSERRLHHFEAAAALLKKAVGINPTRADAWQQYGETLYSLQKYQEAIPCLQMAATLGAGMHGDMEYEIAECFAKSGNTAQALRHLKRSLDQGFRDLLFAQTDPDFKFLSEGQRFKELVGLPTKVMTRSEGWRFDIRLLSRELVRVHYRPFEHVSQEAFDHAVKRLIDNVDSLNDAELGVGCMKLAQMMGDGHTEVWSLYAGDNAELIPVQMTLFEEGLYVTSATAPLKRLLGSKVAAINGVPVASVLPQVMQLTSHENSMFPKYVAPRMLRSPAILRGLHIGNHPTRVRLRVEKADGSQEEPELLAEKMDGNVRWLTMEQETLPLYLRNQDRRYWMEVDAKAHLIYAQINGFANEPTQSFQTFCTSLREAASSPNITFLVIDLRRNGGGNNQLVPILLDALIRSESINQRGHLFIIVGRNTFSAAVTACATIERYCHPVFVGEPTGSSPNFIGEVAPLKLPYSNLRVSISDLFWQNSYAFDYRSWIGPEIYTPPTWRDFQAGRDAAMDEILRFVGATNDTSK